MFDNKKITVDFVSYEKVRFTVITHEKIGGAFSSVIARPAFGNAFSPIYSLEIGKGENLSLAARHKLTMQQIPKIAATAQLHFNKARFRHRFKNAFLILFGLYF